MTEYEINSILDTDLYKLTMMQAVFHQFPETEVEFQYKNRSNQPFTRDMYDDFVEELNHLEDISLTFEERVYLERNVPFLKSDFLDFLESFRFNPRKYVYHDFDVATNQIIVYIDGPWLQTILFEVPILALINSVYFRNIKLPEKHHENGMMILKDSIKYLFDKKMQQTDFSFTDFGTRRRFSHDWQRIILTSLKLTPFLNGTSNVYFAMMLNLKPIGTMAHEWIQAGQAFTHPRDSQRYMFQKWVDEYDGDLGIVLSDTLGFDYFLHDFSLSLAKLFDGVRLDSGDPIIQTKKLIEHYQNFGINPLHKTVVYSDGLSIQRAAEISMLFGGLILIAFGIGTSLTNNFKGVDALQIVIKMTKCNGLDVAKISDTPAKTMCQNQIYLNYLKDVIDGELTNE